MPPKQKRALQEADPNAETRASSTGKGSKKQKQTPKQKENQPPVEKSAVDNAASQDKNAAAHSHDHQDDKTPMDELPPHEYILIDRPMYDFRNEARAQTVESESEEEDEEEDEDEQDESLRAQFKKAQEANKHGALASTRPEHKWIMMRGTWVQFADAVRLASYRSPDSFGMHIYNDFEGYGMHEMVENFLVRFNKEFNKRETDQPLHEMWSTLSALIHWMNHDRRVDYFARIDDAERVDSCWRLIACALLSMLNLLDRSKQVGSDSSIKDLALMIASFLNLRAFWEDFDFTFQLDVLRFANDHEINIADSGPHGLKSYFEELQKQSADHEDPPKAALDRWQFKKAFKEHAKSYGKGGDHYDITKMSKSERASHAYDNKDPLARFSDKDIKSGRLMFS